jgi:hypothetical protein
MPDRDGYLLENEVLVDGEVYRVGETSDLIYTNDDSIYHCERVIEDGRVCGSWAVWYCDGDGEWLYFCDTHFEEWKRDG